MCHEKTFCREMQFWSHCYTVVSYLSKKEGKDQESIQTSTTPDPRHQWDSDNVTTRHHKRELRGQPFPSR